MSDQPPPQPPSGPPPGPRPGSSYQPPAPSNASKFWTGVALSLPTLFLVAIVYGAAASATAAAPSGVSAVVLIVVTFSLGAAVVWGLVVKRTMYYTLGILAGSAVVFVVLAGACLALISSVSG